MLGAIILGGLVIFLAIIGAATLLTRRIATRAGLRSALIIPALAALAMAVMLLVPPAARNAEALKFDGMAAVLFALPVLIGGALGAWLGRTRRPK